jgi:hypothetical protein
MSQRPRDLSPRVKAGVTVTGLLCSAMLVWQSTSAAFSDTALSPSNSWEAGTVTLVDDDGGDAMFSTSVSTANLMPGNTATHCIRVTYTGSLATPATVKVYATALSGTGLGAYLDLVIEEGTNSLGAYSDCGGFTGIAIHQAGTPIGSDGTLGYFAAHMTSYATGIGSWTPTASDAARTYRFRYTLQNSVLAQGLNATVNFVWEARSD